MEANLSDIITINPITRISGYLEIQVKIEESKIIDATNSGQLFRGFEKMLKGRSPFDAIYFTERVCGICSVAHATASTLALENALNIKPPENEKMIRDFMHGCDIIQNHIRHFYQFTLPDFVRGARLEPGLIPDGSDYRLPEEVDNEISKHYIESLDYSRLSHEMLAILGGKAPHIHGIFVGGVTVNMDADKWIRLVSSLAFIKDFVENKLIPDAYIISEYYSDYFENGAGYKNLLSYGLFDSYLEKDLFYVSPKTMINGVIAELDSEKITENVYRSWYAAENDDRRPTEQTLDEDPDKENAYSWIKAARYEGNPMEVGPLARMWLSGNYNNGISTMDRILARVLELRKIIEIMEGLSERIQMIPNTQGRYEFTKDVTGKGLTDTTRGALGDWVSVKDKVIQNYEIITPSAWNLSPADSRGNKGPVEQALMGTTIKDTKNPMEIGRIARSFDPCVSCGTHVMSDKYSPIDIRIV